MNIIVFALKEEDDLPDFDNFVKIYTGIGKVNASCKLMEAISRYNPQLIINFGTAGGVRYKKGDFVKCNSFVQLDMDCTKLGFKKYETPYENSIFLESPIIGTSDSFVTFKNNDVDLVDMEAFALKKICDFKKIKFECYKYITDECDDLSKTDWFSNIKNANKHYLEVMERYFYESSSSR
jgi:adenosylhomocysteine nucleosidase